jgi:two-component system LytT family response regulator
MGIRTLIVDDETLARERLMRLAAKEPDLEVVGDCATGAEAARLLEAQGADLVFLDVEMPGMDGFALMQQLGGRVPVVIFVTAFDAHAVHAFEVRAADYLLKPVSAERFRAACERAREIIRAGAVAGRTERLLSVLEQLEGRHARRLMIRNDGRLFFVKVADIEWIEAAGNYVRIHAGKEVHLMRGTLASLEQQLDPDSFVRIHRSTIVNLEAVRELQPWFAGDYVVLLRNGGQLRLSRWYRDRLDQVAFKATSPPRAVARGV